MTVLDTAGVTVPATRPGKPIGWWGIMLTIATEGTIFIALLAAYLFVRSVSPEWPQGGIESPPLVRVSIFSVILLGSSLPLFWGEHAIKNDNRRGLQIALAVSWLMGFAFAVNQGLEFAGLKFGVDDNAYASLFIIISGLHGLHVVVGLMIGAIVQIKAAKGWFTAERHVTVTVFSLYWHFVDVVWIFVFATLHVSPHLR